MSYTEYMYVLIVPPYRSWVHLQPNFELIYFIIFFSKLLARWLFNNTDAVSTLKDEIFGVFHDKNQIK